MRKSSKFLLGSMMASLVLAVAVGDAGARAFRTDEQRVDIKWARLRFIAGGRTVECPVTVEGSFHSATLSKVENALIGLVSRAAVAGERCTGGTTTILREALPWHVRYAGFRGRLPIINSIFFKLIGAAFSIRPSGSLTCLVRSSETNPVRGIDELEEGIVTALVAEEGAEIPITGEGGFCAFGGRGHFGGSGAVTKLATTEPITVTLI